MDADDWQPEKNNGIPDWLIPLLIGVILGSCGYWALSGGLP